VFGRGFQFLFFSALENKKYIFERLLLDLIGKFLGPVEKARSAGPSVYWIESDARICDLSPSGASSGCSRLAVAPV
jgi:hypothetical protein